MSSTKKANRTHLQPARQSKGAALILVLVVLVLASTMVYTIASRMATHRHRQQYTIDYHTARYACDSAMKYALATVSELNPKLKVTEYAAEIPDWSDLFQLNKDQYEQLQFFLAANPEMLFDKGDIYKRGTRLNDMKQAGKFSNVSDFFESASYENPAVDPNTVEIPGPYGPAWPYITDPVELEIGDATVKIEIEDENAKLPLMWATIEDEKYRRQAQDSFDIFCGYMRMNWEQIDQLKNQLRTVSDYKKFKLNLKVEPPASTEPPKTTARQPNRKTSRTAARTVNRTRSATAHAGDFARLLHSSTVNLEGLAQSLPNTGDRVESPLKYLAVWGSGKVNINTAPRHVLEAAFAFGGEPTEIAAVVIQERKQEPFKDIDDFESRMYGFSDAIELVKPFIITKSHFFSIKVTAKRGNARTVSVATVVKDGKKVNPVARYNY